MKQLPSISVFCNWQEEVNISRGMLHMQTVGLITHALSAPPCSSRGRRILVPIGICIYIYMCVYMYVCTCVSYICSMYIYIFIHVYYDVGVFDQQIHMCVYYDYLTHSLGIQKAVPVPVPSCGYGRFPQQSAVRQMVHPLTGCFSFLPVSNFPEQQMMAYIYISGRAICGIARHGTTLCQRGRACLILIYVIYIYIYIYMRMASATARATYDNIRHDRLQLMTNTNMAVLPLRAGRPRLRGSSR